VNQGKNSNSIHPPSSLQTEDPRKKVLVIVGSDPGIVTANPRGIAGWLLEMNLRCFLG